MLAIHPSVEPLEDRSVPAVTPAAAPLSAPNLLTVPAQGAAPQIMLGIAAPAAANAAAANTLVVPNGSAALVAPPTVQPATPVLFNQFPAFTAAEIATNPFVRLTYNFGASDGSFADLRMPAANRAARPARVSQAAPVESAPTLTSVELPAPDTAVEAPPDE